MPCPVGFDTVKSYCRKQSARARKINVLETMIPKGLVARIGKKLEKQIMKDATKKVSLGKRKATGARGKNTKRKNRQEGWL